MSAIQKPLFPKSAILLCLVFTLAACSIGWVLVNQLGNYARLEILEQGKISVNALVKYLQHALDDVEQSARIIAKNPSIVEVLSAPEPQNVERAYLILDQFVEESEGTVAYLMTPSGQTILSTNRDEEESFVGKNYKFQPYFQAAIKGKIGRYFAVGVTSKKRGYYASFPVKKKEGEIIGVAVVKTDLDYVAEDLQQFENCFLVDPNGIIFLSSRPNLVLKSLWPVDSTTMDNLIASKQFGYGPFEPLMLREVRSSQKINFEGERNFVSRQYLNTEGWSIVLFSESIKVFEYQLFGVVMTAFVAFLIIGFVVIISLTRRSTEQLQQAKDYAELIFNLAPSGLFTVDHKRRVTSWNKKAEELTGFTVDEVIGKECVLFADEPCVDRCGLYSDDVPQPTAAKEYIIRRKDGQRRVVLKNADLIKDGKGNIVGGIESFEDVTEREKMNDALELSEKKYRTLINSSRDAIMTLTSDGKFLSGNKATLELFGCKNEQEFCAQGPAQLSPKLQPDDQPSTQKAQEMIKVALENGSHFFEWTHRRMDGSDFFATVLLTRTELEGQTILQATVRDVTERKKADDEIYKLSYAIEQSAGSIAITDIEGNLEYVNSRFCQLTGYAFEEIRGQNPRILKSGEQPEEVYKDLWQKITSGQQWTGEFHNKRKDGSLFWELAAISPIKNKEGKVINYLKVAEDITQRKEAVMALTEAKEELENRTWDLQKTNDAIRELYKELELKNKELLKLDQLKSDFVSTVSHELRTPLAITTEGLNLILDGIVGSVDEKQKEILITSKENIDRLGRIINDLLDISKIEAGKIDLKRGFVDMTGLFQDLIDSYQAVVKKKNITLTLDIPGDKIYAYVDGDKIIQVMNNLLNNAYKFTPESGKIAVALKTEKEEIHISVTDNGPGISEEDSKKLFQKFQQFDRKHGPGIKGTGLGLAITKALVELHEGGIWAKSKPGEGTTFYIKLPNYQKTKAKFEKKFEEILQESSQTKTKSALMILRLGNYNEINDKYGHKNLIDIMNSMMAEVKGVASRPNDEIFLYNPQNIFVVLPGTDKIGARHVSNRIKKSIKNHRFICDNENVSVEVLCGIAASESEESNREALINQAQEDLARKKKVLIVDDHPQIARILKIRLEASGYAIECVSDGEKALETILSELPDLIVLDIMMPKMNGYEVFGRLKENPKTSDIPIVILTAHGIDTEKFDSMSSSSTPIIEKTGGFENILNKINELL